MTEPDPPADLAAQLAELRGELARAKGEIRVLHHRLEDNTGQTVNLLIEVKRLRGELAEAIEKRRLKPPPAPWWLVGPEQAQAMLAEAEQSAAAVLSTPGPGTTENTPGRPVDFAYPIAM